MCYWRHISKRSIDDLSMSFNKTDHLLGQTGEVDGEFNLGSDNEQVRPKSSARQSRHMKTDDESKSNDSSKITTISDKLNLFQALEVRQDHEGDLGAKSYEFSPSKESSTIEQTAPLMCYRQAELLSYLFGIVSILLVAISVSIACCWRARELKRLEKLDDRAIANHRKQRALMFVADDHGYRSANLHQAQPSSQSSNQFHHQRYQNRASSNHSYGG